MFLLPIQKRNGAGVTMWVINDMMCTECPTEQEGCEKEYHSEEWWDMRKHYRKFHPKINPTPLFTKEARTAKEHDAASLKSLHGEYVDLKDNGGKIVGRGTVSYNAENNSISITGCKIKGRAL